MRAKRARTGDDPFRRQAEICSVFTHPLRIRVLDLLCGGERSVMELVRATRTAQPRLSQQLALMRRIGVVATRRAGATIFYRIAGDRIRRTCRVLHELLDRPGACGCDTAGAKLVKAIRPGTGPARLAAPVRSSSVRAPRAGRASASRETVPDGEPS